jgi:hypothetical protein
MRDFNISAGLTYANKSLNYRAGAATVTASAPLHEGNRELWTATVDLDATDQSVPGGS